MLGLVDFGLFGEKAPACFSSKGLTDRIPKRFERLVCETDEKKLKRRIRARHDYVRYESLRNVNVPRQMGIPHPESYIVQCLSLNRHWTTIKKHCAKPSVPVSRVYVRKMPGEKVFDMNYKGRQQFDHEEADINRMTGARYAVKADISNCFPSIYTHTIPWALVGRNKAKSDRSVLSPGHLLDTVSQNVRDGQTNGLLIGPHASNVLSEMVLTCVDEQLIKNDYVAVRHIDDYFYFAENHTKAEGFIRELNVQLREFELSLNERKTRIVPMPLTIGEDWVRELQTIKVGQKGQIGFTAVRALMDLALNIAQREQDSAVLNYAIKMVPLNLSVRAKRLFVRLAVNLAVLYPYLAPLLDVNVFKKHHYVGIEKMVREFIERILEIGVKNIYPDSIAHGLYCAIGYGVSLKIAQFEDAIIEIDDCLCLVLLLEYSRRNGLADLASKVQARADMLRGGEGRDKDRFWPLIYDVWSAKELKSEGQDFLGELKEKGMSFLSFS